MSDVTRLRAMAEIEEEAGAWVWRLDADEASSQDRRAFEEWLRRDPRHRRAFEDLGGVWRSLDALAEAKRDEKIATFAAQYSPVQPGTAVSIPASAADCPAPVLRSEGAVRAPSSRTGASKTRILTWSAAAAIMVVAAGLAAWLQHGNETQTLSTAVGQQRTASLADGSTVYLNTNTILETSFVRRQRNIRLRKGEALFKVAHDAKRPFFVHAGNTVVRALGTEFNVRMRDARDIEVIVAEGRVEVESKSGESASANLPAAQTATRIKHALTAGQRYETGAQTAPVAALDGQALSNILAWRDGAVVFVGEPLSAAVSELNRYTDVRFIVTDPRVREMKIGGRFKAGDIDEFLDALKKALPVATRRTADNLVYIEPQR